MVLKKYSELNNEIHHLKKCVFKSKKGIAYSGLLYYCNRYQKFYILSNSKTFDGASPNLKSINNKFLGHMYSWDIEYFENISGIEISDEREEEIWF